jgi:hypothetical protein
MAVQTCCPSCGTSYTLEDKFLGKKARCKQCQQYFVVSGHVSPTPARAEAPEADRQAVTTQAPAPPPAAAEAPTPGRRKKKRRKALSDPSLRLKIGLAIGVGVLLLGALVTVPFLLYKGLGGHKPPDLVGKWKGVPAVREEVENALKGSRAPAIAEKFLGALSQKAADELLAVTVQFNKSGAAFYSGNTACIGVTGESDGTWEVLSAERDVLVVRMGPAKAPFEARLAFRDRDSFSLTRLDKKDAPSITFTRVTD